MARKRKAPVDPTYHRYVDARTGGLVACLPPTSEPCRALCEPTGHVVIATNDATRLAGIRDHEQWMTRGEH